ncbi:MAG: glycosyltransferase family 2 protein, partial [Candidatus Orphnella occulta]|nr:glycosyltransferase family 2 protein [Candidatus Orphnella occulta]
IVKVTTANSKDIVYKYFVRDGELLKEEFLTKEGKLAINNYAIQLFRLLNGLLANARYIPLSFMSDMPSGVITKSYTGKPNEAGQEYIMYDLFHLNKRPLFSIDMNPIGVTSRLLRRWVDIEPWDEGGEKQLVKEVDAVTGQISYQLYYYDSSGILQKKQRQDLFAELDMTYSQLIEWNDSGAHAVKFDVSESKKTFIQKVYQGIQEGDLKKIFSNTTLREYISLVVVMILLGVPILLKMVFGWGFHGIRKRLRKKKKKPVAGSSATSSDEGQPDFAEEKGEFLRYYDEITSKASSSGGFGFSDKVITATRRTLKQQLEGSAKPLEKVMSDRFEEFKDWCQDVGQKVPKLDRRAYILFLLIFQRANFRTIVPTWRYYLFLKALEKMNDSEIDDNTIGPLLSEEIDQWVAVDTAFYRDSDSVSKKYRITEEDWDDMFRDKEFVKRILEDDVIITRPKRTLKSLFFGTAEQNKKRSDVLEEWAKTGVAINKTIIDDIVQDKPNDIVQDKPNDIVQDKPTRKELAKSRKERERKIERIRTKEIRPYKWARDFSGDLGSPVMNGIIGLSIIASIGIWLQAGLVAIILSSLVGLGLGALSGKIGLKGLYAFFGNFKVIIASFVFGFAALVAAVFGMPAFIVIPVTAITTTILGVTGISVFPVAIAMVFTAYSIAKLIYSVISALYYSIISEKEKAIQKTTDVIEITAITAILAGSVFVLLSAVTLPGIFIVAVSSIALIAFVQPVLHALLSSKIEKGQRLNFVKRTIRETLFSISFWGLTLGTKTAFNYMTFLFLKGLTISLIAYFTPFVAGIFIVLFWSIFVMFFFVDTSTFMEFYKWIFGLGIGYKLGLGKKTSPAAAPSANNMAKEHFNKHLWTGDGDSQYDNILEEIAGRMQKEALITGEEFEDIKKGKFDTIIKNEEARERLLYYFKTILMDMAQTEASPEAWEKMHSLTVTITAAMEVIKTHLDGEDGLNNREKETNLTKLTNLIMHKQDEWDNQLDMLQGKYNLSQKQITKWKNLQGMQKFEFDIDAKLNGDDKEKICKEIEHWANMRFQTVYRTVMGLIRISDAYKLYAKACFPNLDEQAIEEKVRGKLQLLWAYQAYADMSASDKLKDKENIQDIHELLIDYPQLQVAYYDQTQARTGLLYALRDGQEQSPELKKKMGNIESELLYRKLKVEKNKKPEVLSLHKCFKPMNQNNMIAWIWGDITFMQDANCDFRLEDAIKMPNILAEFSQNPLLSGIAIPEYIFTNKYNWIGQVHGFGDRTWTSFVQRVLARTGSLGFYGHSAFFRTEVLQESGTIVPDYVSEDLMLAIRVWLKGKGYYIDHKEYMQAGKAREITLMNASVPFQKFAAGAIEMAINRQMRRLFKSKDFTWYQKLSLFFTLFFFYKKPIVAALLPVYILTVFALGISGFSAFPLGITLAFAGVWFSQMISFSGLGQLMIEKGIFRGLLEFFGWLPTSFVLGWSFGNLGVASLIGISTIGFSSLAVATAFIIVASIAIRNIRTGTRGNIPEAFGIFPKLILVYIGYVPLYTIGAINGLLGAAKFILTGKGWGLGLEEFSQNIFNVISSGKESYRLQIQVSGVFLAITALAMFLWQSSALWFSFFFIASIFLWTYSTLITLHGIMPATTGFRGRSGWLAWTMGLKNRMLELYTIRTRKEGHTKRSFWFITYDMTVGVVLPTLLVLSQVNFVISAVTFSGLLPFVFMLPITTIGVFAMIWFLGSLWFLWARSWIGKDAIIAKIGGPDAWEAFEKRKDEYADFIKPNAKPVEEKPEQKSESEVSRKPVTSEYSEESFSSQDSEKLTVSPSPTTTSSDKESSETATDIASTTGEGAGESILIIEPPKQIAKNTQDIKQIILQIAGNWTDRISNYYSQGSDDPYWTFKRDADNLTTLLDIQEWLKSAVDNLSKIRSDETRRRNPSYDFTTAAAFDKAIMEFEQLILQIQEMSEVSADMEANSKQIAVQEEKMPVEDVSTTDTSGVEDRTSSSGTVIHDNISQLIEDGQFNFDKGSENIKVVMNR